MVEQIFNKIDKNLLPNIEEIVYLLNTTKDELSSLFNKADEIRKTYLGDDIFLRGIIEFSNYCYKNCAYCGIQNSNTEIKRYRILQDEIIATCKKIELSGQTTVVLQSGEDPYYTKEKLGELISAIKKHTNLAITFSVGERDFETYKYWKEQGMDRYLLRFETSNKDLYQKLHSGSSLSSRLDCIKNLQELGVQTGSGFLIGLPGETLKDLACDILFCTELNLDMIGVGPFISSKNTPLHSKKNAFNSEIFFKVIAILRILNKKAHIPATTAFDAIVKNGRSLLLQRGANIFMPNITPIEYKKYYQLYPNKPGINDTSDENIQIAKKLITALDRKIGSGPGHSVKNR